MYNEWETVTEYSLEDLNTKCEIVFSDMKFISGNFLRIFNLPTRPILTFKTEIILT